jgi:hypothetical protein
MDITSVVHSTTQLNDLVQTTPRLMIYGEDTEIRTSIRELIKHIKSEPKTQLFHWDASVEYNRVIGMILGVDKDYNRPELGDWGDRLADYLDTIYRPSDDFNVPFNRVLIIDCMDFFQNERYSTEDIFFYNVNEAVKKDNRLHVLMYTTNTMTIVDVVKWAQEVDKICGVKVNE